jgi:site-specific DNA-methyltransferase (adenine-specific)
MEIDQWVNKIINGDCLKLMKNLPDKSVDLVLTDPPYNAKNIGPHHRVYSAGQMQLPEREYKRFCKAWFKEADRIGKVLVFTPGIANVCFYPQPHWIICWHKPAAVSFNRMGGFNAWEPIMVYGKSKVRIGQDYVKVNTLNWSPGIEKNHPCPKPPSLWEWIIERFSKKGGIVLDPMIGSGTTAVVAQRLDRQFIGMDVNPEYCQMTEERLKQQAMIF